jgi:hypothetical protein
VGECGPYRRLLVLRKPSGPRFLSQTLMAAALPDLAGRIASAVFASFSASQPNQGPQAIIAFLIVLELLEGHLLGRQLEFASP